MPSTGTLRGKMLGKQLLSPIRDMLLLRLDIMSSDLKAMERPPARWVALLRTSALFQEQGTALMEVIQRSRPMYLHPRGRLSAACSERRQRGDRGQALALT